MSSSSRLGHCLRSCCVHSLTEALALQSAASIQSIPVAVRVPTPASSRSPSRSPDPPTRRPLLRGGRICRGDFVSINHSRPGQPSYGRARYSKGRFIYVYNADSGQEVFCHEANLTLLSS